MGIKWAHNFEKDFLYEANYLNASDGGDVFTIQAVLYLELLIINRVCITLLP